MAGVDIMENRTVHGFTTREAWDKAFQTYFSRIKDIDQKNHELLMTEKDCDSWIRDFKKQSINIRQAYLANDQFKQHHIFYFTKHPENWTAEIADSLIAYLYRYWYLVEDVEAVYDSAISLQKYYEKKHNEIMIMKCKMVLLSCYYFLDEVHFVDVCLTICKEIQALLIRHYDELSEEDLSMAMSVYDFQNNIRYDNLHLCDDFEEFFDTVLLPEYEQTYLILNRFMANADITLPINASLSQILRNTDRMFVSIVLHIHKDTLRMDQLKLLQKKSKEMLEKKDGNRYARAEDMIGYLMAHRFTMNMTNDQLIQKCVDIFHMLPDPNEGDYLVDDIISTAESFAFMINTILHENPSSTLICRQLLEDYVRYLLSLPYGKVMTYIVDQTVYRSIIPLLRYLDSESEIFTILLDLTIFRQIQTAIHSQMVGKSAVMILKYMIAFKPELLKDLPGLETKELVQENEEKLQEFIMNAALVHDVGKILCTNEINMQYRRITDVEFETIKFHPTSSSEILNAIPQLRKYHDIAAGHHKSFDGTFGYPGWFDNLHSKQKLWIDLIRICDSLDAATDTFGRLYAEPKHVHTVLKEFELLKGTSYSDVLVDFICEQEELQRELRELMEFGREDVYRDIYSLIQKKRVNV